jgi:hypothetical protein
VGAGTLEDDICLGDPVSQQPIGLDVALPVACPIADQGMIPIPGRPSVARDKQPRDDFDFSVSLPRFWGSLMSFSNRRV